MSAIAARMAATASPVRLKVLDKGTAMEAVKTFASGGTDLVVARADVGDLSNAKSVLLITHAVTLIVVPPGSSIESIDALKGKTVGVVSGEVNRRVVEALTKEYELDRAKVQFKDVPIADVAQAFKSKQVAALLIVVPIAEKYLALLRSLFPKTGKTKPTLIPIESAGAIATLRKYYESYELPKGTLQGSPPIPDDDMTTLRVPFYLLANKKLSDDVVGALAKAVMEARRDLINEYPLLTQIKAPNTDSDSDSDKDAFVPIHPGAAAYFDGDQKSFFDKYGDPIFYGSMLLGGLASVFAGAWRYMMREEDPPERRPLIRLYALTDDISEAESEAALGAIEQRIDEILKAEFQKDDPAASQTAILGLATHRLEHLIEQRRAALAGQGGPAHVIPRPGSAAVGASSIDNSVRVS